MQQNQVWYWLQGACLAQDYEFISWKLFDFGACSIEELSGLEPPADLITKEPVQTTGLDTVQFKVYLSDYTWVQQIKEHFYDIHWLQGEQQNQDWDEHWKNTRHPVQVSNRLWIRPPWVPMEETGDQVILQIDAKMAFGTGEHESTRLIAQLLEALDIRDRSVLDIGTGTGILAMYALRLGAARCYFTEIDPVTLPCIQENFVSNAISPMTGILGGLEAFNDMAKMNIILCNMIRSEFWPLKEDIMRLLGTHAGTSSHLANTPPSYFLLSGQLVSDKSIILEWAYAQGLQVHNELEQNEWWAVAFTR
jgi:ribosomal protein L11 methyltransferase